MNSCFTFASKGATIEKRARIKRLSVLGSTGSIGRNVLEIAARFPDRFEVLALSAGRNIGLLREQIATFKPRLAAVQDERLARDLRARLPAGTPTTVLSGTDGYVQSATLPEVDTVVSAMVGAAGLLPTYEGICASKDIALANKEVLVMAGSLIMKTASQKNVSLVPIDSEHSAIFQCLQGQRREDLRRIILTASGGPFLDLDREALDKVTPADALRHPNWNMGRKITIDCATLMNKGLEVIEAKWLFGVSVEQIAVTIHPQSIIHSLVEYVDGSVIGQLGVPDMRVPIAYALSFPERLDTGIPRLSLPEIGTLTFRQPDMDNLPCLRLAYAACEKDGPFPIALNAANEVAVTWFLEGRVKFTAIARIVEDVMNSFESVSVDSLSDIMTIDRLARIRAEASVTETGPQ